MRFLRGGEGTVAGVGERSSRPLSLARRQFDLRALLALICLIGGGTIAGAVSRPATATSDPVYGTQLGILGLASSPSGVAVDEAGDIFVADANHDRIVELLAGTHNVAVLPFAGLQHPTAVALDSAGDVFAVDSNGQGAAFELQVGSDTSRQLPFSGLESPSGIAVDASGDVFVSDIEADDVVELPAGATSSRVMTQLSGLTYANAVAVDSRGDLYVGGGLGIEELAVGASTPVRDSFNMWVTAIALNAAGDVYFTVGAARTPAYELAAGTTSNPTPLPLGSLNDAQGVALDAAGNLYVGIPNEDEIAEIAPGGSTYTTLPLPGLGNPGGLTVDSAGDVYIADGLNKHVVKLSSSGQQSVVVSFTKPSSDPQDVALDAAGDLYVTDYFNGMTELTAGSQVIDYPFDSSGEVGVAFSSGTMYYVMQPYVMTGGLSSGGYGQELPFDGELNEPQFLAIDQSGGILVTDSVNNTVLELPPGTTNPITLPFSGLSDPMGIAVDAAGDIFVADSGNNRVLELPAGSSQQVVLPFSNLDRPIGLAVDSSDDVFVTDDRNGVVELVPETGAAPTTTTWTTTPAPSTTTTRPPTSSTTFPSSSSTTIGLRPSTTIPSTPSTSLSLVTTTTVAPTTTRPSIMTTVPQAPPRSSLLTVDAGTVSMSKGVIGVPVTCWQASCSGSMQLSGRIVVRTGRSRKRVSRSEMVVLATATFSIPGSRNSTVKLQLTAAGRQYLVHLHLHPRRLVLQRVSDGVGTASTLLVT